MRAIWKGSISFALISIQVKVYTATKKKALPFHLLHKSDYTPLEYLRWCPNDKVEVPWTDIVRGYEYQKKKYVTLTDEELEKLPQKASKSINIQGFIDAGEIEPIYMQKPYYLEPEEASARPYALLREAMRETGKVALAKFTLKDREHLAIIRLYGDVLLLDTLHYADEIASPETLDIPRQVELSKTELSLATELISKFTEEFKPEDFQDTYTKSLLELIDAKVQGREVTIPPPPQPAKVVNLMDALRKSLERAPKAGVPAGEKIKKAERAERKRSPAKGGVKVH